MDDVDDNDTFVDVDDCGGWCCAANSELMATGLIGLLLTLRSSSDCSSISSSSSSVTAVNSSSSSSSSCSCSSSTLLPNNLSMEKPPLFTVEAEDDDDESLPFVLRSISTPCINLTGGGGSILVGKKDCCLAEIYPSFPLKVLCGSNQVYSR